MLKVILSLTLLTSSLLISQTLSRTLTQRGGEHNALFLNPTYLISKPTTGKIEVEFLNASLILDNKSLNFIQELKSVEGNREISTLLKENIGETITLSANNFSYIYQTKENISYSLGIANTLDGYFITHSGFGSKGAMESVIEQYKAVVGTVVVKEKNFHYGLNLKLIEKAQTIRNYAINEIATQSSLWDYMDNSHTKKESAVGLDMGVTYTLPHNALKSKLSLALLNIGNTSFKKLGKLEQTTTVGLSLEPNNTFIKIDYLDNHLRADMSKEFFNQKLKLHTGVIYNALSLGLSYKFSIFKVAIFSYKVKEYNQKEERKNELSLGVTW